ncbi:MAG: glycoside hydrolase family 5 protein [Lachnospiraceae bacterium]|nr:glycoside hydrolase family 5 protein [Lachnospiraceae bacterium]
MRKISTILIAALVLAMLTDCGAGTVSTESAVAKQTMPTEAAAMPSGMEKIAAGETTKDTQATDTETADVKQETATEQKTETSSEPDTVVYARPSVNGQLAESGGKLVDEKGTPVLLHGVSTHGITWFPDLIDENLFHELSADWDSNLIRLAVYSTEYANGDKQACLDLTRKGIEAAIACDQYVIVDWHVLEEHDPNVYLTQAEEFFDTICEEYADTPNLIFEICNEPNGETTWDDIQTYANKVIPGIRKKCPDSLILVGTPDYDKNLTSARRNPLHYSNVMYVLHFYASTHGKDLMKELQSALIAGFPVFVSECGLSESTGDGKIDYRACTEWFSLLRSYDVSFAVWSFSNKDESSALLSPSFDASKPLAGDNLTQGGQWVRELIQGEAPIEIPVPTGSSAAKGTLPAFFCLAGFFQLCPCKGLAVDGAAGAHWAGFRGGAAVHTGSGAEKKASDL